jgi:hypothetical protein
MQLVGVRLRRALDHGARMAAGGLERALDEVPRRAAVVVDEHDDRGRPGAPREVAVVAASSGARRHGGLAQRAVLSERMGAQELARLLARVVPHDHLEALARQRLVHQRVQQPAKPEGPVVRGHRHRDLGLMSLRCHRADY